MYFDNALSFGDVSHFIKKKHSISKFMNTYGYVWFDFLQLSHNDNDMY